ncbi:unnamed protein product [Schistosoma curassoni]|uniref:Uncharacterized protein n=1 Tax=Schistosoma curassoni TaxID=6186 RepID=A0A183L6J1_9TREM|nr:unnamed protein product [Schistosoma curassoni]
MWETGKTSQIATEMRRYNLAVLGISETHWTQAGQQRLNMGEMLLCSGGTIFPHNCIHKATWISPDHTTENQIDHICINKNTAFLRDTNKINEFKISLNNRFQALQDLLKEEETTIENNWKGIKEALTSTCREVLGLKKHHHKECISIETLDRIKERKNKKTAINNSRTRAKKFQAQA